MTGTLPQRRSILLHGLSLVVRRPRPLLWTYAANLGLAVVFSAGLHTRLASVLDHSLAAERLNTAFDLGTVGEALLRLNLHEPSAGSSPYLGLPLYLLCYFVLVPGTLFCYQADTPCRIHLLVSMGFSFFWRFVRIALMTVIASVVILGPLAAAQGAWSGWVDEHIVGWANYADKLPGLIVLLLVGSLVRLYFDLVEVYTVQLNEHLLPSGTADRRVRMVLKPAWRTLKENFGRLYLSWMALLLLGVAAFVALSRVGLHTLAQPRVWPVFLLTQLGLLLMLATRFWQRAAESVLAADHPLVWPATEEVLMAGEILDVAPDPEPSLPGPDRGIYDKPL